MFCITWAHPQMYRGKYLLSSHGLSDSVTGYETNDSVPKYLKDVKNKRERYAYLFPRCMDIVEGELRGLEWADECFREYVTGMFSGADVSQLKYFYSKYGRVKNKKAFFLHFLKYEL